MKRILQLLSKSTVFSLILWAFTACKSDNATTPAPDAPDLDFYVLSTGNQLSVFNAKNLATAKSTLAISNLAANDNIIAIDFRPATGQLYGLGSSSRLYAIDLTSGRANPLGAASFTPAVEGTSVGFDFNPTVDRIRVVSNTGQNLRLNPIDGTIAAVDGSINPTTAKISAAAYTNSFAGSTATVLYDIDYATGKLFKQDPPNTGTLVEAGSLGIIPTEANGFDIGGTSSKTWTLLTVGGSTKLYSINLTSGMATAVGTYTFTGNYRGFAVGLGF